MASHIPTELDPIPQGLGPIPQELAAIPQEPLHICLQYAWEASILPGIHLKSLKNARKRPKKPEKQ